MPESRAMTLAILSALPEEQHGLAALLEDTQVVARAGRRFVRGHLHGQPLVLGLTGIGKVAAATTTTTLIEHLDVQQLVFTGVAGGIGAGVQVGDVVVAQAFLQHDMDARPLFPRWQVPGYGAAAFACDPALVQRLQQAAQACTAQAATWQDPLLGARAPRAHAGLVVSGDQFIATAEASQRIVDDLQTAAHAPLAVEMEGAAIAQVCADYDLPFAAIRTISDRADDSAHVDFPAFVERIASRYALHMVDHLLAHAHL